MPIASYFLTISSRMQSQDSEFLPSSAVTDTNSSRDPPKIIFAA